MTDRSPPAADPTPGEPPEPVLLDARHLICPLPVLRARKRLSALAEGTLVRVLTTDPAAVIDLPHFCAEAGHTLLASAETAEGHSFLVRRGATRSGDDPEG
jgi:tRNA 2-thiouridine synthesizing protein A